MSTTWTRKPIVAALGLASTLFFAIAGCGGKGSDSSDAVVVSDPTVTVPTPGSGTAPAGTGTASTAPTPAASTSTAPAPTDNVKAEGWGTLKGQIKFDGTPPAPKDLVEQGKAAKDPISRETAPIKSERLIVDGATKGVKNVLVYIPKPSAVNPEAKSAAATAEVEFDQKNCTFEPHVLAVMNGAKILMKNSDSVNHNIDSKLKNNATNPNVSPSQSMPFSTQGAERAPGEVICDIHNWMKAYWMVLDSPYFAVTDAKGNFEIKNVPAGTQKVVVWQEAVGFVTAPSGDGVAVKADGSTTFDKTIPAAKVRPE